MKKLGFFLVGIVDILWFSYGTWFFTVPSSVMNFVGVGLIVGVLYLNYLAVKSIYNQLNK